MKCYPSKSPPMEMTVSSVIIFHTILNHSGIDILLVRDSNALIDTVERHTTSIEVQTVEGSESIEHRNNHHLDGDKIENVLLKRVQWLNAHSSGSIDQFSRSQTSSSNHCNERCRNRSSFSIEHWYKARNVGWVGELKKIHSIEVKKM